MLSPNYYAGWNHAVNQMSADMVSRKDFVRSLATYEAVLEYKSHGQDFYQGVTDAVAAYQGNRRIPIQVEIKSVSFFKR